MLRAIFVSLLGMLLLSAAPASAQRGKNAGNGAALYTQRYQSCHEGGAVARAPSRDVISALSAEHIVEALESGTMSVQGAVLTPDERRAREVASRRVEHSRIG